MTHKNTVGKDVVAGDPLGLIRVVPFDMLDPPVLRQHAEQGQERVP